MSYQFEKNKLYNYLGEEIVEYLKKYNTIVAGGSITSLMCNREINDIDVYFRSEKDLIDFIYEIWGSHNWVSALTKKATLMNFKVGFNEVNLQMIHFDYFDTVQDVFNTFDFTVCMGAFDFKTEEFVLHDDFLKHNSQRILKFNKGTAFPIVSLLRVQKYKDKGYTISKPEFLRVVMKCMDLNINTYDELKEQLGGMYGINYDKLLDFDKDKEFSLDKVIDHIEDLNLHEDYFVRPVEVKFDSVDDIVEVISKTPVKYFKRGEEFYKVTHKGLLTITSSEPFNGELIDAEDYFKNTKFYKFVKHELVKPNGEKYVSFYDKKFEYKIGEIAVAKGSISTYGGGGRLYFNEKYDLDSSSYSSEKNKILIEVEFTKDDFTGFNMGHITAKQCKVLRVVLEEEYEKWIQISDEDTFY